MWFALSGMQECAFPGMMIRTIGNADGGCTQMGIRTIRNGDSHYQELRFALSGMRIRTIGNALNGFIVINQLFMRYFCRPNYPN
jgi:hypothetical protein